MACGRRLDVWKQVKDGNCAFRSFSHQWFGSPDRHTDLRHHCASKIAGQIDWYGRFVERDVSLDRYVQGNRQLGEWAGHVELQALADEFKCFVEIYDSESQSPTHTSWSRRRGLMRGSHAVCGSWWC